MTDERLKKSEGSIRESRAMTDRPVTENRDVTDQDRLDMFRMQHFQHVLPDLPQLPGYHVCWLTTTNNSDSLMSRMRLGYEPLLPEDIPGLEFQFAQSAENPGWISLNEMVAAKIRYNLYAGFMKHAHHDEPNSEEAKIAQVGDRIRADSNGVTAARDVGDGMEEMRLAKAAPRDWG